METTPMSRLPVLDPAAMTAEQRAVHDAIASGPRGKVEGPLAMWLYSPGLAQRAQDLGAFCRYGTNLPPRLSELAIICVGADWKAGFEFHVHGPIAIKAGVDPAAVEAIRRGETPVFTQADEEAVYRFSVELLRNRRVSDATYRATVDVLGERGVVELVGILGYYGLICITINAFEVPVPDGPEPFADL
jgi:4-carboxymuconolactone decarboxylase